jgi:Diadenosine tetraphosphate (Ap4A) hydrolase and other HIT family hydrolases
MSQLADDCIFCKIIRGELPSTKVFENEKVLAFNDINPAAPVHVLFVPKRHIASMDTVRSDEWDDIAEIHKAAQQVARQLGIAERGYRLVNNCNKEGGQVVYHLHYHLLGGEQLGPLNAK